MAAGERPLVAVTGASGFAGGHLVVGLSRAGLRVQSVVRRGRTHPAPPNGSSVTIRDINDERSLATAFRGCQAVVHLAACVHARRDARDPAGFRRVNVDGTRAVTMAAAANGISHVVFISTAAVLPELSRVDDHTPPAPATVYGESKLAAEAEVRLRAASSGMTWTILRPPGIYGPEMKGNLLALFRLIATGLPVPVPPRPVARALLYVGNLVQAVTAVLDRGLEGTYLVADSRALSTEQMVRIIGDVLGRRGRMLHVPVGLLDVLGWMGDFACRFRPLPLNTRAVALFTHPFEVDASRFWAAAGRAPAHSAEAALAYTAAWYHGAALRRTR